MSLPTPPPPSAPTIASDSLKIGQSFYAELLRRLQARQAMWGNFWFNPNPAYDPQSLATAYEGKQAGAMAQYFGAAAIDASTFQQVATLFGETLSQLCTFNGIDYSKYLAIPAAYTVSTDGKTITLNAGWSRKNQAGRVTLSGPNNAVITQ